MSPTSYHCSTPRCLFSTERPSRQIASLCQSLNCECKVTTFFRHDQIFSPLFSPLPHFLPQFHQSAPSHLLYLSSILSIIFILYSFYSIYPFYLSRLSNPLLLESLCLLGLLGLWVCRAVYALAFYPLAFTSSLIPRKGLHLGNRWSVSTANATTGCHILSHHTPKGGYTREKQRPRMCRSRPLNITPSIILTESFLELLLNHQTQLLRLNHLNATAIIHQFTHQVIGQLHAIREDRVVIVHLLHLTVV